MKKIFILFWYIVVLAVLFFMFEWGVRLIAGNRINFQGTSGSLYQQNVYGTSYGWKPGASGVSFGQKVQINYLGLRGPNFQLSDSSKILLLIGDSVLFGVGVPDTSIISHYLQQNLGEDGWQVLNTGVIGYRLDDYLNVLKYWVNNYPIKSVILFYVLNDIYQKEPAIEQHRRNSIAENILGYLRTHSKGYVWLKEILLARGEKYFLYDYKIYQDDSSQIEKAVTKIKQINKLCSKNQCQLSILLLPSKYQYLEVVEKPWLPQEKLLSELSDSRVSVYDIAQVFQNQKDVDQFYLFGDGMHFSRKGHKKIASYILSHFKF